MKTLELINTPEAQLVPQLRQMKIKELERHADKLLAKFGADYAPILAAVTRAIPDLNKEVGDVFGRLQTLIGEQVSCDDSAESRELLRRVAVIMMLIIQRQFQKIHEGR
jgi:hypothetical protein